MSEARNPAGLDPAADVYCSDAGECYHYRQCGTPHVDGGGDVRPLGDCPERLTDELRNHGSILIPGWQL